MGDKSPCKFCKLYVSYYDPLYYMIYVASGSREMFLRQVKSSIKALTEIILHGTILSVKRNFILEKKLKISFTNS